MKVRASSYITSVSGSLLFGNVVIQPDGEYHLHYFVEGAGFFRINAEQYALSDGALLLTLPGDSYCVLPPQLPRNLKCYRVFVELGPDDSEVARMLDGHTSRPDRVRASPDLRYFLEHIVRCCRINSELSMKAAGHHVAGLVYLLLDAGYKAGTTARSFSYVERAIAFMRENVRRDISLADICAKVHITEVYFIRIFKAHMHVAPMKFFMRLKIDEAAALLLDTDLSVHDIAELLAFSSDGHFSRTFKQYMNVNPLSYRNSQIRQLESDKIRSEKELANAYRFLETLIDAAPDLIFFKNTDSVIMGCNKAFCNMLGMGRDQIVGRTSFEIFPREMAEFLLKKDQFIYKQNRPFKNEEWLVFPSGERKKYEVYKAPFHDAQGKVRGLFGISRDITERETAIQKLELAMSGEARSNKQKSDFLVTMAEEIINAIGQVRASLVSKTAVPMLQHGSGSPDREFEYLVVLAKEIVAFTHLGAPEFEPEIKSFDLTGMLRRLEAMLYNKYSGFNIDFRLRLEPNVPEFVLGDELRLFHVLAQLINSCIKYSQQGRIRIRVSYFGSKAVIRIKLSQAHFSSERISAISSITRKAESVSTSIVASGDIHLVMAEKLLQALDGTLDITSVSMNQVEFSVAISLPAEKFGSQKI